MIRCEDWRLSPSDATVPLISAEIACWRRGLDWDVTEAWRVVEPAREAGQLPGVLAWDERARPAGWASFLLHGQSLQVMALVGRNAAVTRRLLDAVLESPEAALATSVLICVRESSAGLREALLANGFAIEPYRYLAAPLADRLPDAADATGSLRPWTDRDDAGMTHLCARAYATSSQIRAFAPHGEPKEWREYIHHLLTGPGCGVFQPSWSVMVSGPSLTQVRGGAVVTRLAPGVAHIAQMAVVPEAQGQGIGRAIVNGVMRAAAVGGCQSMTLLVASSNAPAVRVYERAGFSDRGAFVVATRDQPRVSISLALATGGASTRL